MDTETAKAGHPRHGLVSVGAISALACATVLGAWRFVASPLPERLSAPASTVVEFRDGSIAHVFVSPDGKWRIPSDTADIDPAYISALIRLEDKRFFKHPGVDAYAVVRAVFKNAARARRVSGASTITLQLVRVLEPRPRTFWSKAIEAVRAFQLERRMSKHEILNAYLQFVPYGRNIEGIEAASLAYFGHRAKHLSPAEIATLLAVPQDPGHRYPTTEHTGRLRSARDAIATRLIELDSLPRGKKAVRPEQLLAEIQATAVPAELKPFPRQAPHVVSWLVARYPDRRFLKTTLESGAQRVTERLMGSARAELSSRGIFNGATVVLDHRTGEVLSAVGNFDFWDSAHAGQVVGFAAPRSPGSTLKPFLYAMGIDRGITGPDFLVPDVPETFGGYAPKNFDGQFSGLVTMKDALSRSLNIPFVNLLREIGVESFIAQLRLAGALSLVSEPGRYGLSAAVGGVELNPAEVAALYGMLADEGRYHALRWLAEDSAEATVVLSPGASWLTRQALSQRERPDFPGRREWTQSISGIHWKTGTSFGHRDAWAVGSSRRLTAVVWLGNFDNTPSVSLVGAEAAGPLLFDLLEALEDRASGYQMPRPPDLVEVEVCSYSGHVAGEACPHRKKTLALRSSVPTKKCPFHAMIDVDSESGLALTPSCRAKHRYESKPVVFWPATVRRWLKDQERTLPEPPRFAPDCQPGGPRRPPAIVSPLAGQVSMLIPGLDTARQRIPFEAQTSGEARTLSWFVDGTIVGESRPDERIWWTPSLGRHELYVSDEMGLGSKHIVEVRERPQ